MARIDVISHVSKESGVKMKIELRVEVKEDIQASKGRMVTKIEALKSYVDYLGSNNFIFHHDTSVTSIHVPKDTVVAPPPPSSDFFCDDIV